MLFRKALGQAINAERILQNRTLRDVSEQAIMSLGYLSEIERGMKEISSEFLVPICEALFRSEVDLIRNAANIIESSKLAKEELSRV